jgi:mxaJ protein
MRRALALAGIVLLAVSAAPVHGRELRVCADPNNLPFSNDRGEGFENKIAELIAGSMGAELKYTWWAQRRGFVRNTLKSGDCDLWPGVISGFELLATSLPYYRSSYAFVTREDRDLDIVSFDDPRLRQLTIGVQMIGNDAMNTPPTHALARRGIVANVRGFMLYGDYSRPNPASAIVDAVATGTVDVAIVWGPLAGYFGDRATHKLRITPVSPSMDGQQWPMVFDIAMGFRRGEPEFKSEINRELDCNRAAIRAILDSYHVPEWPSSTSAARKVANEARSTQAN